MAPKVWGIILLILGGLGLMMMIMNVASILGGGMKASSFSMNMSPEAKAELDRVGQVMVESALHRWSFWTNAGLEVVIAGLSVVAGFFLVIRPRPKGRKLAVARALIVLLALPVYGYESMTATGESMDMMAKLQQVQIKDIMDKQEKENPSKNQEEREHRQKQARRMVEGMQPLMKGIGYGTVIVMVVGVLILNGLLLFFMTRPKVKDYMDHVQEESAGQIPGFDPSMGLAMPPPGVGPPPANGPPHPGQPSPADQPPPPPQQQTPPV
jgi:hypothetical protein